MYTDRSIIVEYEEYLIGNKQRLPAEFVGYTHQKQTALKDLFRFLFSDILRWTPEMVKVYINMQVLDMLKAGSLIKYIDFPPELERDKDLFYFAKILFPNDIRYSHKDIVIHTYTSVLNKSRKKFPPEFFLDAEGRLNFSICLNYYISSGRDTQMIFADMEEAYEFFADDRKANALLTEARLYLPCMSLYEDALDMFHDCLSSSQRNEFLYRANRFRKDFEKAKQASTLENAEGGPE